MKSDAVVLRWNPYLWSVLLVLPSAFVVYRFLGPLAVCAYATGVFLLLRFAYRPLQQALERRLSQRTADILLGGTLAGVAALALVVYPLANSGWGWRRHGTDRDDALVVLVNECLAGRYPYYARTYLGNPITPMPGAGLLALPFVVTKQMALQNVFWLSVAALSLRRRSAGDSKVPLALLWSLLLLSPEVLRDVVTGDDMLANALYVPLATGSLLTIACRPKLSCRPLMAAAALLGIALSSRGTYLLLVPIMFGYVRRSQGAKRALLSVGSVLAAFSVITLPFYLYDPAGFSPLHTLGKLNMPTPMRWAVIGAALLGSLLAGARTYPARLSAFYARSALVMGLLVVAASLSTALRGYTWYALDILSHTVASLVFAAGAVYLALTGESRRSAVLNPQESLLNASV